MARVVNEMERSFRRNEILDSAQKFIYTTGYEQMSIQDLLGDVHISKGAFYHYFESKQDLLEALVERTQKQAEDILVPIFHNQSLPALEKLEHIFHTTAQWKTTQKAYMLALLQVWHSDNNAIVRQKQVAISIKWLTPIMTDIVRQGIQEGVIKTPFPDHVGNIIVSLMVNLGDSISKMLLSIEPESDELVRSAYHDRMQATVAAFTDSIERVLGAPPGSICLFESALLKEWVMR